jgi:hypothetical protein
MMQKGCRSQECGRGMSEIECIHETIEYDLKDGVEMHDDGSISISIECEDCHQLGYAWFLPQDLEWR